MKALTAIKAGGADGKEVVTYEAGDKVSKSKFLKEEWDVLVEAGAIGEDEDLREEAEAKPVNETPPPAASPGPEFPAPSDVAEAMNAGLPEDEQVSASAVTPADAVEAAEAKAEPEGEEPAEEPVADDTKDGE